LFVVSYLVFDVNGGSNGQTVQTIGNLGASNVALGVTLAGALLFIGVGLIQWARKLMGDQEIVEMRHPARSSDEDREEPLRVLVLGTDASGIARRPLVRNSLLGAVGVLIAPAGIMLKDLAPTNKDGTESQPHIRAAREQTDAPEIQPDRGDGLAPTVWEKGVRVVPDVVGTPIRAGDLEIGDLINAEP